jgi:hypothetical protein
MSGMFVIIFRQQQKAFWGEGTHGSPTGRIGRKQVLNCRECRAQMCTDEVLKPVGSQFL